MQFSTLTTLLFAASALASPANYARTAPSTDLVIRGWNSTTLNCDYNNAHLWGEMGPAMDTWGDGGSYTSYSLSRDLAANETLQVFASSGGVDCGTLLYPVSGIKAGCYQSGTAGSFACMKMITTAA